MPVLDLSTPLIRSPAAPRAAVTPGPHLKLLPGRDTETGADITKRVHELRKELKAHLATARPIQADIDAVVASPWLLDRSSQAVVHHFAVIGQGFEPACMRTADALVASLNRAIELCRPGTSAVATLTAQRDKVLQKRTEAEVLVPGDRAMGYIAGASMDKKLGAKLDALTSTMEAASQVLKGAAEGGAIAGLGPAGAPKTATSMPKPAQLRTRLAWTAECVDEIMKRGDSPATRAALQALVPMATADAQKLLALHELPYAFERARVGSELDFVRRGGLQRDFTALQDLTRISATFADMVGRAADI